MSKDLDALGERVEAAIRNCPNNTEDEIADIILMMREQMARVDSGLKPFKVTVPKVKQMPAEVMLNLVAANPAPVQKMRRS